MKKKKKISVLVLIFALVFTMMPVSEITAEATTGVTGSFGFAGVLSDVEDRAYRFADSETGCMQIFFVDYVKNGFTIGNCMEVAPLRAYRVNGKVAYCIEHGVDITPGANLTSRTLGRSYLEEIYTQEKLDYVLENISLCLLYGRQEDSEILDLLNSPENGGLGFRSSSFYGQNAQKYNLDDWEAATRQLIHESQQRFRDENFSKQQNGLEYTNGLKRADGTRYPGNGRKISENHYLNPLNGKGAKDIYNYMAVLIKNHRNFPTGIGAASQSRPQEISLQQGDDGIWRSKKILVNARMLADLKVELPSGKTASAVKLVSGKENGQAYFQYEVTGTVNTKTVYTVKRSLAPRQEQPDDLLVWECKDGRGGHLQALATGAADPIARYVRFTAAEAPEPTPENERPQPLYFPTFEIPIQKQDLNPGWDGDPHTGMGDASLAAAYTLERQIDNGPWETIDHLTLDEFGSARSFTDQPWQSADDLARTESGEYVHTVTSGEPPVMQNHCTVTPTRTEWNGTVRYRVTETRPDGRFIEPDTGIREYEANYHAVTEDSRTCADQPQNWSEITYDIQFRVTSGSDTVGSGNGSGKAEEVDRNLVYGLQTFVNDCYRGKFTLSKSLQNEDVFSEAQGGMAGGQKDSQNSLWKIRLESGGWENHPYLSFVREADEKPGTAVYRAARGIEGTDNAAEAMRIGSNGDLYVYDIPYGTYLVEEYAADDESYLKEQFRLVIGEHGCTYTVTEENDNRYDYNIRDKIKTNKVKVIKTDAETGKQVYAAGTKFYVRYMGNPLKADPTASKNYGRLLPNAESITADGPYTFEADENGEITIPYELEFGTYRLEEWLLPEGCFVGEYHGGGAAGSHDYGTVEEGQRKALEGHSYEEIVGVYDDTGNPVKYREKDSYKLNEVFNFYTFRVEKQETHADGNFGQKVDKDGNITAADASYDPDDYPYQTYYQAVGMSNNPVKGKIGIVKKGETLQGFRKEVKEGKTVFTPVYAAIDGLKGAVYQIFAAVDIWLHDGSDGPAVYDSETEKELKIPKTASTNANNLWETVQSTLSRFFRGSGDVYETGELAHASGAKLWYYKDRAAKEDGRYTRVYVSPEQKDTAYSYSYETTVGDLKFRYDVAVRMNYQASGKTVTDVEVTKVTSVQDGYALTIPVTLPSGSVGETRLDPLQNFLAKDDPLDTSPASALSVSEKSYTYERNGGEDVDLEGNPIDLSDIGVRAYERENDQEELPYEIPEGWTLLTLVGDGDEKAAYVLITKTESDAAVYQILLDNGVWQPCDASGNFCKMTVQQYKARYEQEAGDPDGFTFSWDGFAVASAASAEDKNAVTTVTKQDPAIQPLVEAGAGYTYQENGGTMTFTGREPSSPIYFLSQDGIRTEMFYSGGSMKTILTLPQSAVDRDYRCVVPTLNFREDGRDNIIDWYSALTPDQPENSGSPIPGVSWKASRIESAKTGEQESYRIEIVSDQNADDPMEITFADGYTMTLFADTAESGNGVGVIVLDNVYKTNRASLGQLVDTITTDAEGKAVSKLLPLGRYIIRESKAPSGYVTDERSYEAELKYQDQFTPLVWEDLDLKNEFFTVELELAKVFETAYGSGIYQPSSGAVFGLYNAEALTRNCAEDQAAELLGIIDANTLLDIIKVDENGKAKAKVKLPYGTYYLRELSAKSGYLLNDMPFYFVVREEAEDASQPCRFGYGEDGSILAEDGIAAQVVMQSAGCAEILVETQVRYPMPKIEIDGTAYALTEDQAGAGWRITAGKEVSGAEIEVKDGEARRVTLPNGKKLDVAVTGNTYRYTYDGVEAQFVPKVSYTGWSGRYTSTFTAPQGEDLITKTQTVTVSEAGADPDRAVAVLTHTPVTKEEILSPNEVKTIGVLDEAGCQTYRHTAVVRYQKADGTAAMPEEITLAAGDVTTFRAPSGADVTLMLDADGRLKTLISSTSCGMLQEDESVKATLDGEDRTAEVVFVRSATLARQDHRAKTLQIKIHTLDGLHVSAIENDAVKPDIPQNPAQPENTTPEIQTTAKNAETGDRIAYAGKRLTIIDTVQFSGLRVGQEYKVKGILMDKAAGKPLLVQGKEVTAETAFRPTAPNGTVDVAFTFDGSALAGKDLVVFEQLFWIKTDAEGDPSEEKAASHEDIEDEGQTVTIREIPETPETPQPPQEPQKPEEPQEVPKTGDAGPVLLYSFLMGLSACAAAVLCRRTRPRKTER